MEGVTTMRNASLTIYIYASVTTIQGFDYDTLADLPRVKYSGFEDFETECLWYYADNHNIDLSGSTIEYINMI